MLIPVLTMIALHTVQSSLKSLQVVLTLMPVPGSPDNGMRIRLGADIETHTAALTRWPAVGPRRSGARWRAETNR